MGDRGQIAVLQSGGHPPLYLYTHWGGYDLPRKLAAALDSPNGRGRWQDSCYLARIILDTMTGLGGGETGHGICTEEHGDLGHPVLVVDSEQQKVGIRPVRSRYAEGQFYEAERKVARWLSFEEFIAAVQQSSSGENRWDAIGGEPDPQPEANEVAG